MGVGWGGMDGGGGVGKYVSGCEQALDEIHPVWSPQLACSHWLGGWVLVGNRHWANISKQEWFSLKLSNSYTSLRIRLMLLWLVWLCLWRFGLCIRTANMSWRTCVVVKQMQSNPSWGVCCSIPVSCITAVIWLLSQFFQPMAAQLSSKAALPLAERIVTASDRCINTGSRL